MKSRSCGVDYRKLRANGVSACWGGGGGGE